MSSPTPDNLPPAHAGVRILTAPDIAAVARELARVGCDAACVQRLAPDGLSRLLRLDDLLIADAPVIARELRAIGGDAAWHVGTVARTDMVLLGTEAQLQALADRLAHAAELAVTGAAIDAALRNYDRRNGVLHCGGIDLPFGAKTYVMGILNVTPDSFSGDGLAGDVDAVLAQAARMIEDGADILDIGGESTRPGAEAVATEDELRRVIPSVRALAARFTVPISVDTTKAEVARQACAAGATIINDISGLRADPAMGGIVAAAGVPVVVMHIKGTPRTMQQQPAYDDLMTEVCRYLAHSSEIAVAAGIPRDQVVLDPGFGFGKTVAHNLELLRRLRELTSFGQPLLIGTSRKSTIGTVLGGLPADERVEGTAATVAVGIANGADIVRVHDVRAMARVAKMTDAIIRTST